MRLYRYIVKGVFPDPPKFIFPTEITGMSIFFALSIPCAYNHGLALEPGKYTNIAF
jgi:hypothetical protein